MVDRMPNFSTVGSYEPKNILINPLHFIKRPVTIAAGQGIISEGQVMAIVTATGKAVKYNPSGSDGSEVAVGILADPVDATVKDQLGNVYIHAYIKESECVGLDAAAKADLPNIMWG